MIQLNFPLKNEEAIKKLKIGDIVRINGTIFTARDEAHKFLLKTNKKFQNLLKNSAIYHCGPIVKGKNGRYGVIAAGPTTSIREEPYEAAIIKNYGIKAIIGKGGMGEDTLMSCKKFSCVYLSIVGGIAALITKSIKKVRNVYMLKEFGVPEAIWEF